LLNMDFSNFVVMDTTRMDWIPSPKAGVWRKPLAREEAERGHATSIVKYDAGASFNSHNHPLGEEILVLEGIFSDETGDFHAGTYFRNPKGFVHAPFSTQGCTILVKLHQMNAEDKQRKAIETDKTLWHEENGRRILELHSFQDEKVELLETSEAFQSALLRNEKGKEIYVIKGGYSDVYGSYTSGNWIRLPPDSQHAPLIQANSLLWIKQGHLSI